MRNTILRWIKQSVLLAAVSLGLASLSWSQPVPQYDNRDYNRHDDSRERGFHNGYDDGSRRGQFDAERGRRFKFKTDDWEDSRGFERWMGDKRDYKYAYREGYERGYREAYGNNGYRYRDRDDRR